MGGWGIKDGEKGAQGRGWGETVAPRPCPHSFPGWMGQKSRHCRRLREPPWEKPLPSPEPLCRPPHCPFFLSPPPVPPTIEQGTEGAGPLVHRAGELVTLACPVRGSPPIHMSWLKDGLPLPLSQRTHLHGSGRILR